MQASDDFFQGFDEARIPTAAGEIYTRSKGQGAPLVLLHGFPQCHVMWHKIAPVLAEHFRVVVMDLRGYGRSFIAPSDAQHAAYSKRVMAQDVIEVMAALGAARFAIVGHDRGARVAYRLALDHPDKVTKLALLDIIPTIAMWEQMDARRAMQVYHWSFLAQASPMPENLVARAPEEWLEHTLASWTATKDLAAFDVRALQQYRQFFKDPARIHACCEDYRAGATRDAEADEESRKRGEKIRLPTLVLWGETGIPAAGASPLDAWREFVETPRGVAIESGHFLAEENPKATLKALLSFLKE